MVNCKFELASTITWIYILNDQPSEPIRWKYGFNMPFFILIIKSQIKESFLKENDDLFYDFTYSLGFGKFNLLYCLWSSYSLFVYRKVVLENFANFTGKHLLETLFLIAAAWSFIKKETLTKVFPCEFCEIFQNTFLTEQSRVTVSAYLDIKSFGTWKINKTLKIFWFRIVSKFYF